jgi:filamentous hemagglutinin family protein
LSLQAQANPLGGTVTAGQATISGGAGTLTVQQLSNRAILNWQDFSIGAGEITRFIQPSATSAVLNRVVSANPSSLLGSLQSNGQVFLINPNGIVVGPGAQINVGSFLASTRDVSDASFLAGGSLAFSGSSAGAIDNQGSITAASGDVVLIARQVRNSGSIAAPEGAAALAAGDAVLYVPQADQRVVVQSAPGTDATIDNAGVIAAAQAELRAAGGNVYALAINNTGMVSATGVSVQDGHVVIAAPGSSVELAGTVSAMHADGSGGLVQVSAENIDVAAGALIDTSARLGQGGRIEVIADGDLTFAGTAKALGGQNGGDGGFVETSGLGNARIEDSAVVDTRAPNGATGTWLLDPADIVIANSGGTFSATALGGFLNTSNFTLDTTGGTGGTGTITVTDPIAWTSTNQLTMLASNAIGINASITAPTGRLLLQGPANPTGTVTTSAGAALTVGTIVVQNGGALNFNGAVTTADFRLNGSVMGAANLTNPNNALGKVTLDSLQVFLGDVNIVNGASVPLHLDAVGATPPSALNNFSVVTQGNLVLDSGFSLSASGVLTLAALGGNLINDSAAGANALIDPGANHRNIIYQAADPGFVGNGITGLQQFGVSFPSDPVGANGTKTVLYYAAPQGGIVAAPPPPPSAPAPGSGPAQGATGATQQALGPNDRLDTVVANSGSDSSATLVGYGDATVWRNGQYQFTKTAVFVTTAPTPVFTSTGEIAQTFVSTDFDKVMAAKASEGSLYNDFQLVLSHSYTHDLAQLVQWFDAMSPNLLFGLPPSAANELASVAWYYLTSNGLSSWDANVATSMGFYLAVADAIVDIPALQAIVVDRWNYQQDQSVIQKTPMGQATSLSDLNSFTKPTATHVTSTWQISSSLDVRNADIAAILQSLAPATISGAPF